MVSSEGDQKGGGGGKSYAGGEVADDYITDLVQVVLLVVEVLEVREMIQVVVVVLVTLEVRRNATINYDEAGEGSGYINRRDSISGYTLAGISGKYDKYSTSQFHCIWV